LGKAVKKKPRSRRWLKLFIVCLLIGVVAGILVHRPLLRMTGNFLVVSETPAPADAIVVLAGGDPARSLEAVRLYKAGLAPFVVVTTEPPPRVFDQLKSDGIVLNQTYENYMKVIAGYGVPPDHIVRIETYVFDTLDELRTVKTFANGRGWKRLLIVTSNFHTRRSRMTARYVLEPDIHASVIAATQDSWDPSAWFESQAGIRTFAIEAEKLVTYTMYLWPRLVWRGR
jgi:uncharacterized SAM-binding protein YcdF (DUF218 family)